MIRYTALARFTTNIGNKHRQINKGEVLEFAQPLPEFELYVNPKDNINLEKDESYTPVGLLLKEEVTNKPKLKKDIKNYKKTKNK